MIIIAVLLLLGSLVALTAALGLVAMPNGAAQRRARDLVGRPEPVAKPKIMTVNRLPRGWLAKLSPQPLLDRVERNMILAGRPDGWSLDKVIVAKPVGAGAGALFFLLLVTGSDSTVLAVVGLGAIVLGYFVPDLLIYNQATKRQQQMQKELPDLLDQIVISIEAGVGFEAALARAGQKNTGPLADEISRLVQDMTLGLSRREAYLALADRTSVDELRGFARAIVQAEEYGVSIASVVRSQAKEMRLSRKARAEAKAQQVPVKILLPLMSCVLPVLFVIVLGPAVVTAYAIN